MNEKYYRFSEAFDAEDINPKDIHVGDLMIYDGDYLVLFYDDFATNYKYTPLGAISQTSGLREALGSGDVDVVLKRKEANDVAVKNAAAFDLNTKTVALNSGYAMPIYGIGAYSLLDDECVSSVRTALENGVRLIDTAYMYHNE